MWTVTVSVGSTGAPSGQPTLLRCCTEGRGPSGFAGEEGVGAGRAVQRDVVPPPGHQDGQLPNREGTQGVF